VNNRSSVSKESKDLSKEEKQSSSSSFYSDEDEDNFESSEAPANVSEKLSS
jgi:hypothetical protein